MVSSEKAGGGRAWWGGAALCLLHLEGAIHWSSGHKCKHYFCEHCALKVWISLVRFCYMQVETDLQRLYQDAQNKLKRAKDWSLACYTAREKRQLLW
jgi:hypothetical protein